MDSSAEASNENIPWPPEPHPIPIPKPHPTPCPCNDCPPDPAFACSLSGENTIVEDAYVANAYRGNLFLCPGSAMGVIGGLLHDLTPPQHYSHMGIFVANWSLIRHCMMSPERLQATEYYTGSILGQSVPKDGFTPEHVEYGWPGTVTQSVEQAYFADQYGTGIPPGHTTAYAGSTLTDLESQQNPKSGYLINALSFDSVSDDGHHWYPPLVVQPCPLLQTPAVTAALNRVADEALKIYAHYCFYAYTRGNVGEDTDFDRLTPVQMPVSMPAWDNEQNKWADWSNGPTLVTTPTIAAVCASLVWQAVQNANKDTRYPRIVLDWAKSHPDALGSAGGKCARAIPPDPDWSGDLVDNDTPDGLYVYAQHMRQTAASWLHDNIAEQVYDNVKQKFQEEYSAVGQALDDAGRSAFIAAAELGVDALWAVLGLGPVLAALGQSFTLSLIELLYDMPDDIGNQIVNAFAFGCINGGPGDQHCVDANGNIITSVDSENWKTAAGVGRAVSPDNIHMFWDAPGPTQSRDVIQGIYGYNVPAKYCVGYFSRPTCVLVPSTGTAVVTGFVRYKNTNVFPAHVTAGCATDTTRGADTVFTLDVRSGASYKVVAHYDDPQTGLTLYGEKTTPILQPNQNLQTVIELTEPPNFMRQVEVKGWIRVDDVYITGADHGNNYFGSTLFLQAGVAKFNETAGGWGMDTSYQRLHDSKSWNQSTGDANGVLMASATLNPSDLSVDVQLKGRLNPNNGSDEGSHEQTVTVAAGQSVSVPEFDLDNGDAFPDRAYFRSIVITNRPAQAI